MNKSIAAAGAAPAVAVLAACRSGSSTTTATAAAAAPAVIAAQGTAGVAAHQVLLLFRAGARQNLFSSRLVPSRRPGAGGCSPCSVGLVRCSMHHAMRGVVHAWADVQGPAVVARRSAVRAREPAAVQGREARC